MIGKNKFFNKKTISLLLAVMCCIMVMSSTLVFALNDVTAEQLLGAVIDIILGLVALAGVLFLVVGIVLMVLAMRQEDSDSKTKAGSFIIIGIVAIILGSLIKPILTLLGVPLP